ncbi:unnamed protein product [Orchesella dallaii]|uniref:Uncharacterized protein n=1 Tax=Orchesella dallaii TaxID=48710 RepID=A0ABP1RNA2_9HEXA
MAATPSHLTCHISDFYPVSHFEQLSKRVLSKSSNKKLAKNPHKAIASPREEIYKSMCREIQNADETNMNSLVHKASGILKLTHYDEINKARRPIVSWDIDGRRILKYDDGARTKIQKSTLPLTHERSWNKTFRKKSIIMDSIQEPIFGLKGLMYTDTNNNNRVGAEGEARCELTKLWEDYINTGDVSKLWESQEEEILSKGSKHSSRASTASVLSGASGATSMISNSSAATTQSLRRHRLGTAQKDHIKSWKSDSTIPSSYYTSSSSIGSKSSKNSKRKQSSKSTSKEDKEKVDRVQHICVVNGSAVSFKDFGFENFTNWFGDDSLLEANLQRSQPKVHLELDLTDVMNKDIKIRLLDGYRLEVEARRQLKGTEKSLRLKETLLLPKGYKAEDLIMCRTQTGKLIVQDVTSEPVRISSASAVRTKSKKGRTSKGKSQKQWRL